jgi:hypothetical protein
LYVPDPDLWRELPEHGRAERGELAEDQCVIDNRRFFQRGLIALPINDDDEKEFFWGVWVELEQADFVRSTALWYEAGRESEPPYPVTIANQLPLYPPMLGLSARLYTSPVGIRPRIVLDTANHPLVEEQQEGITLTRVFEINAELFHD